MLFSEPSSWFALQVIPRHEQKVKAMLECRGYMHFLPTFSAHRKWSDRTKIIEQPLLPGYVFCKTANLSVSAFRSIPGVIRIMSSGGKPQPIYDEEIEALQHIVQSKREIGPFSYFKTGQTVKVVSGPLSGIIGVITRVKNRDRLIVSVDLLMRSICVELDKSELETLRHVYGRDVSPADLMRRAS